jgi:hypothetical protein
LLDRIPCAAHKCETRTPNIATQRQLTRAASPRSRCSLFDIFSERCGCDADCMPHIIVAGRGRSTLGTAKWVSFDSR